MYCKIGFFKPTCCVLILQCLLTAKLKKKHMSNKKQIHSVYNKRYFIYSQVL